MGGALPDIDTEGAAIEKMGAKSAQTANKTIGKLGGFGKGVARLWAAIGKAIDVIFLAPLGRLWRFLSQNLFGRVYLAVYHFGSFGAEEKSLGQLLHWNGDSKPWAHRGGITHSFSFMLTSCVLLVPVAFIFQSPEFLLGAELGIVSHLFADSLCKSGVKFFFPFQPKIGFDNENGAGRGRDIRLLPKGMQVSTGKDRLTNRELDAYADQAKAMRDRKLRFREKLWQWIFKVLAALFVVLLVVGVGARSGGIAFSAPIFGGEPIAELNLSDIGANMGGTANGGGGDANATPSKEGAAFQASGNNANAAADNGNTSGSSNNNGDGEQNDAQDVVSAGENSSGQQNDSGATSASGSQVNVAQDGGTVAGVVIAKIPVNMTNNTKPEIKGPLSLTKGDVSIRRLPKGIMKMPDESLWVIGVGPVSKANLDNTGGRWIFTEEEKEELLRYAAAQRFEDIPTSVSGVFTNTVQNIQDTAQDVADEAQNTANEAKGGLWGWLSDMTGVDLGGGGGSYQGGFMDMTQWTDN